MRICYFGCKVTKKLDINRVLAKKKWKNIIGDFYKYLIKSAVYLFHPLSMVWKIMETCCK